MVHEVLARLVRLLLIIFVVARDTGIGKVRQKFGQLTGGKAVSTPISNNNASNQSVLVANRQAARSIPEDDNVKINAEPESENRSGSSNEDSVNVSRTGELLNHAYALPSQGTVNSPEQAGELAQQLKTQIASNPAQALEGLSSGVSKDLLDLLKNG